MGRRKKQPEYPEIEIPNEKIITIVFNTPELVIDDKGFKELYLLMDDYHEGIDKKLEQDKQKRKDIMDLLQDIRNGLKKLRDDQPKFSYPPLENPEKNYCEINIGGKWVNPKPKRLGQQSFIIQKSEEDENND